ncbi:N-acyl-aromatic-L-amino acid amidohydrolase (carboxylate-forming) B-like [Gouania willdenowi]|uniref:N-acyl-aromatic-L-amino acid amidohydrolase n=1 Tax=Gouania willdenowi TaxID=441366 RepID=A0A8C5DF74_GOUWI|nr:N-acyl-aromatic-L-amino acid amidohydrolase (carboxylate-forming) B-like [Gouania willdenowi]
MEHTSFPPLSRVAICGGTHGNELSGVYIVKEMQKQKVEKIGSVSVISVLSNPPAIDVCRRYTETDLNRCFSDAKLSSTLTDSAAYEMRRAHELNAQLGPKGGEKAVDLIIDLHNTTSNMGVCLILSYLDWLTLHICKYIQTKMTSAPVTVMQLNDSNADGYSLDMLGKHGFAIEVGPQPHGVLRADIFNMMKRTLDFTTDWLQEFNDGHIFEGGEVETYSFLRSVDYPRDASGQITAAIHPQLQDKDFTLLQPGDPMFLSFSGETVKYEGEPVYPMFVNECAYYEKKIAFHLAEKITLKVPSISVKN